MPTTAPYLSGDSALETMLAALAAASRKSSVSAPSSAAIKRAIQVGWLNQDGKPTRAGRRLVDALTETVGADDERHAVA